MNATWKRIAVLLVSAVVLYGVADLLVTRKTLAMLNIRDTKYIVHNEKSPLLDLLILPEDLPDRFTFHTILVTQNSSLPTKKVDIVDGASSTISGFYGSKEFTITTRIHQYNSLDINELLKISNFNSRFAHPSNAALSGLGLVSLSSVQKYECFYSVSDDTLCRVGIILSDKIITLEIEIQTIFNRVSIEEFLNLLLNVLKKKIE